MEDASRSSPISFSSTADEVVPDGAGGSAAGSLHAEGVLSAGGVAAEESSEFGFGRADMGKEPLAGTVGGFDRHVFLCYKSPETWPSHLEAAESDRLPRILAAAIKARKDDMAKRTRLTICEGEDGTESSNGDVLIFPDMIRYRRLTHFDVENFVDEVLVKDTEWLPGTVETLTGSYVFVCAHGSRDRRCGVCGPALINRFREEIGAHGLQDQISVSACSHIGGHKYAGNVVIFSSGINKEVTGHWYGYVTPDDVPMLLEQHIAKGKIVDRLWRGQMGLSEEDQKQAQQLRLHMDGDTEKSGKECVQSAENGGLENGKLDIKAGCCQGIGSSTCCQNPPETEKVEGNGIDQQESEITVQKKKNKEGSGSSSSSKGTGCHKTFAMPSFFETWEREDTYAALAVVTAIASVAVAYSCYRQLR